MASKVRHRPIIWKCSVFFSMPSVIFLLFLCRLNFCSFSVALTNVYSNCFGTRNPRLRSATLVSLLILFVLITSISDKSYPYDSHLPFERDHSIVLKQEESPPSSAEKLCDVYNISKDYKADFKCIETRTNPPTAVCIYEAWRDMYISHDLEETGLWEPQVLYDIQEVLIKDPNIGFIDVGAHIGYYTLIAANMGHKVLAVEPFYESCYRLHRSLVIQGTYGRVKLLHNAVADRRVLATIHPSGNNQGDTRIDMVTKPCIGSCLPTVRTILLDDLLEVINFTRAVMKLDIQGFEHKAFQHATKLLDQIHVSYIFMEWMVMRGYHVSGEQTSSDHYLVEDMLLMLFQRNYRPYALSADGGHALDPALWDQWPNDIVWHRMLDTEEQRRIMRNHYLNWP